MSEGVFGEVRRGMDAQIFVGCPFKFCLLCKMPLGNSPYSVCYDASFERNVWGGDSHDYVGYICVKCGNRLLREAERKLLRGRMK